MSGQRPTGTVPRTSRTQPSPPKLKAARQWAYDLRGTPDAPADGPVTRIPGAEVADGFLIVPDNAKAVTEKLLRDAGHAETVKMVRFLGPAFPLEDGGSAAGTEGADSPSSVVLRTVSEHGLNALGAGRIAKTRYQLDGVTFAVKREDALMEVPPGGGKTVQYLAWALWPSGNRPIVVVTVSKGRWHVREEFGERYGRAEQVGAVTVLEGLGQNLSDTEKQHRVDAACDAGRVIICSWEILHAWAKQLAAIRPESVVWDEVHHAAQPKRWARSASGKGPRFARLDNISASAALLARKSDRRLAGSGTPVMDRRRNLWSPLDLVEPGQWGPYRRKVVDPDGKPIVDARGDEVWQGFASAYCGLRQGAFGLVDTGTTGTDELLMRLDRVRWLVDAATVEKELPPARIVVDHLPPELQDLKGVGTKSEWGKEIKSAGRDPNRLLEIGLQMAAARKRSYVLGLVEESLRAGQKVCVLGGRVADVVQLGAAIKEIGVKLVAEARGRGDRSYACPVWVTHGGDSDAARHAMGQAYYGTAGVAAFVSTGYAVSESVDWLKNTQHAILAMLPWRPGELKQWMKRFHRLGGGIVLIRLVCASRTADDRIASALLDKLPDIAALSRDSGAAGIAEALEGVKGHEEELLKAAAELVLRDPSALWGGGD